jgi:ADP-heptose:LPS heptosyltransferase
MKKDTSTVAVIRSGAIGDSIVLFPLLRAIRQERPGARLLAIGRREAFALAEEDGLCDRAVSPDAIGLWTLYSGDVEPDVRAVEILRGVETVLDLDGAELPAGRVEFLGVADWRTLSPLPPADFLKPAAEFYLQKAGFPTTPNWTWQPPSRLGAAALPIVAVAPGAGSIRKRASAEWFVALGRAARRRGCSVALVKGEADREAVDEYLTLGGPVDARFDQLSLTELRRQLSRCLAFAGNDSGISHLAAYAGIAAAVRFVASDPRVWAPQGPNVLVVKAGARVEAADVWERLAGLPSLRSAGSA